MKIIDTCGMSCPEPLILTKKIAATGEKEFQIIVDSKSRLESVQHILHQKNYKTSFIEENDTITITANLE